MKPFLTAEWRNLILANYRIDPLVLKPYLPCRTELDTFNGEYYVSLVGFLFHNTRLKGFQIPFHKSFEEVNLRFYVRYRDPAGWRRGVVFIKEIVPKRAISFVANTFYSEKYQTLPMKHDWKSHGNELEVSYSWKFNGAWNFVKVIAAKEPSGFPAGSKEEFITEHYWGYTFIDPACSGTYEVRHPKWKIHQVRNYESRCDTGDLYGEAFAEAMSEQPASVFLAEGSEISVFPGSKIYSSSLVTEQ
jgi:uncharacterized protein YqjF (DUF2071 family)